MTARTAARSMLDAVWSVRPASYANRVIYYHSVHPTSHRSHRPDAFAAQMRWLTAAGFESVRISDLIGHSDRPRVAITFDDGYRDNLEYAVPILSRLGLTATFFVVAGLVSDSPQSSNGGHRLYADRLMLTEDDLRRMAESGFEIGSHGLWHRNASELARHDPAAYRRDLSLSRTILQSATGKPVTAFAYPNGQRGAFSARTKKAAADVGIEHAATTLWGTASPGVDRLTLPRCEISAGDTIETFAATMQGRRDYMWVLHRSRRGARAWS